MIYKNTGNPPESQGEQLSNINWFNRELISAMNPQLGQIEPNPFQVIADGLAKVLIEKNKRYGDSALNPINVFNGKSKVGQRADDKISRIQNSVVLRKNDIADLIGYLFLICKENDWTNFEDQID